VLSDMRPDETGGAGHKNGVGHLLAKNLAHSGSHADSLYIEERTRSGPGMIALVRNRRPGQYMILPPMRVIALAGAMEGLKR
jgi:hypothetical protein